MEIRAIKIDSPAGKKRTQVITCGQRGDDYHYIDFPQNKPLNKNQIEAFIAKEYKVKQKEIHWPKYIEVPKQCQKPIKLNGGELDQQTQKKAYQ